MKNFTQLAVIAIMGISLASCDKKSTTTTPTTTTPTPTTTGPTAASPTPSGSDISGALISIKMTYSSQVTGAPFPIDLETEIGSALFYSAPGSTSTVDAGAVTVNTIALDKQASNNTYSKLASVGLTPTTLNFDNGSDWSVGGSGSVTAFTYSYGTAFPNYNGTMPTSVTKANGISLSFTTSNLSAADSVYVLVAAGNVSVLKAFSATAGSITISAADLSALPVVSDNSAIFEICPFKYNIVTKNSKKYVFVKEQALVKNININ